MDGAASPRSGRLKDELRVEVPLVLISVNMYLRSFSSRTDASGSVYAGNLQYNSRRWLINGQLDLSYAVRARKITTVSTSHFGSRDKDV